MQGGVAEMGVEGVEDRGRMRGRGSEGMGRGRDGLRWEGGRGGNGRERVEMGGEEEGRGGEEEGRGVPIPSLNSHGASLVHHV